MMNKKKINMKWMLTLAAAFAFVACDTDVEHKIAVVDAPEFVSSKPGANTDNVNYGNTTITVTYDKNIFFATADLAKITLTGDGGNIDKVDVYGSSKDLVINAWLSRGKSYTLSIPEGVILGPNKMPVAAVSFQFTTADITPVLVNSAATTATRNVYKYLLDNYDKKTLSATVANANWNTDEADRVFSITGKYPAMNCFDYIHLPSSPSDWIDYSDITPVKDWWDAGGLVLGMWHWNVPVSADSDEYAFYREDTEFDADNATVEGTWENDFIKADLAKVVPLLKQLQDAGIVVIWRPFHEAAGGWFWWGKNAESCKRLWITMYDYFKTEGLNNLIWVWTSEKDDDDWYPGDAYVDMIGRDLYTADVDKCTQEFTNEDHKRYPNKMVALTECGTVGLISEQWNSGARWSWFMAWYGTNDEGDPHGTDEWWTDAMNQDFVVTRDQLPSFQ